MARYYRPSAPQYSTSPLARALSGALAVWTGQQQGRVAREQQDEEDAQRETQAAVQHLMQFSQMERQGLDQDQDRYKMALSAPGLSPDSRNELVQRMLQPQTQPTDISPMLQQLYGRKRGQNVNFQFPQMQAHQQAQLPQLSFLPPGQEEAYAGPLAMREKRQAEGIRNPLESTYTQRESQSLREGRDKGIPIDKVRVGKEFGFGGLPVRPSLPESDDEKFRKEQQTLARESLDEDRIARRQYNQAQLEATKASREAVDADRDAARVLREKSEAQNTYEDRNKAVDAAVASGDPAAVILKAKERAGHVRANAQHLPGLTDDPLDPTPRVVTRMVPKGWLERAQSGLKARAAGEAYDDSELVEHPELESVPAAEARTLEAARQRLEFKNSKEGKKLAAAQIPRLWNAALDPKLSEESRNDALRRLGAIAAERPELQGLFPTSIKLERLTPWQQEQLPGLKAEQAFKIADRVREKERDELQIQILRKKVAEADGKIKTGKFSDDQKQGFAYQKSRVDAAQSRVVALDKQKDKPDNWDELRRAAVAALAEESQKYQSMIVTGDAVGPVREDVMKRKVEERLKRAAELNGGVPLTQKQINDISRSIRGVP